MLYPAGNRSSNNSIGAPTSPIKAVVVLAPIRAPAPLHAGSPFSSRSEAGLLLGDRLGAAQHPATPCNSWSDSPLVLWVCRKLSFCFSNLRLSKQHKISHFKTAGGIMKYEQRLSSVLFSNLLSSFHGSYLMAPLLSHSVVIESLRIWLGTVLNPITMPVEVQNLLPFCLWTG